MADVKEKFPFVSLPADVHRNVLAYCGDIAPDYTGPDITSFREFLRTKGQAALPEAWLQHYLSDLGMTCLEALEIDVDFEDSEVRRDLNRGILLFTGTMLEAGGGEMPYDTTTLRMKNDMDRINLALESCQEVSEQAGFAKLLKRLMGLFDESPSHDRLDVAQVGAGLAQIIAIDSVLADKDTVGNDIDPAAEQERAAILDFEAEFSGQDIRNICEMLDGNGTTLPHNAQVVARKTLPPLPFLGEIDKRRITYPGAA